MPTATFKFDSDYLVEARKRYKRQQWSRWLPLPLRLLVVVIFVAAGVWMLRKGDVVFGLFVVSYGAFLALAHHVDYWLARRSFRKSPFRDEVVTIEFAEAGVHSQSSKHDSQVQWSAFTKVAHFRDGVLVFLGPKRFDWIPFSSLSGANDAAELEALLRAKIQEHRIVE